jgi:uncharacterized protein YdeI (YjbR/CyaY-like superfamily)
MTDELYVTNRDDWHSWLERNYYATREVWLVYFKKHTGKPSIPYEDSVEEASCFGWVDTLVKKLDDKRFARKFVPRKTGSKWSESNKKRAERMMREGRMTEAGLARIRAAKESGEWFKALVHKKELVIPPYLEKALASNKKALESFDKLALSHKRNYVGWIDSAKKEETRVRRLAEAIRLLEQNKKLGLK